MGEGEGGGGGGGLVCYKIPNNINFCKQHLAVLFSQNLETNITGK